MLYIIRHGQTTGDLEDRYGGNYDDRLTELGRKQAQELAGKLENEGIQKIFASTLIRAKETAQILGENLGIPVEEKSGFCERNMYGIMTGMVKAEAKEKYPELVEELKNNDHRIPQSESLSDFKDRIENVLKDISESGLEKIAIVTHGGPIWLIFREILNYGDVETNDCGYAVLKEKEGSYTTKRLEGVNKK